MIKLVVDKWCENCNKFEPKVEVDDDTLESYNYMTHTTEYYYKVDTTVRCVHAARCNSIKNYIKTQLKEKSNG